MKKQKQIIWFFVLAVVFIPLTVFAVVSWYERNFQALPVYGNDRHTVDQFSMTNQFGKTITLENWENKIIVVDFFFTSCPSICPKMTNSLKLVRSNFVNDSMVQINSFSVDPDRDSVARLFTYAKRFAIQGNWNLLTGNKMEIYRLARKSFLLVATDGDGGPNDFIHSEKLVLVDTKKRIRGYYNGTSESEVAQLVKDINKLKKEN